MIWSELSRLDVDPFFKDSWMAIVMELASNASCEGGTRRGTVSHGLGSRAVRVLSRDFDVTVRV